MEVQEMRAELAELKREREAEALAERLRGSPWAEPGTRWKLAAALCGAADADAAISALDRAWRRHEHDIRQSQRKAREGQKTATREPIKPLSELNYKEAARLFAEDPEGYQQAKALAQN